MIELMAVTNINNKIDYLLQKERDVCSYVLRDCHRPSQFNFRNVFFFWLNRFLICRCRVFCSRWWSIAYILMTAMLVLSCCSNQDSRRCPTLSSRRTFLGKTDSSFCAPVFTSMDALDLCLLNTSQRCSTGWLRRWPKSCELLHGCRRPWANLDRSTLSRILLVLPTSHRSNANTTRLAVVQTFI